MWVKVLLLIISVILIAFSFPRSISAWLDVTYRWMPETSTQERLSQLESLKALGTNVERGHELGKSYFTQALETTNPELKNQYYAQALQAFEGLLAYDPHHKSGLHNMAAIHMNKRQYAESQLYFSRLLNIVVKRDFGANVRLSYYRMCLKWSIALGASQQLAQEKFLLLQAKLAFASTKNFLYWRWNSVVKANKTQLNYIDLRLEKLAKIPSQAPEDFIEVTL